MIDKYLSDKLKAISFFLIILVVFLHSYNITISMSSGTFIIDRGYNSFIQYFISYGLTRIAVPMFFMISGYLFFQGILVGSITEFKRKYLKRFKSLFLPYFFWTSFGILFYFILQSIPQSKPFFSKLLIQDYTIKDYFNTIFINLIPYQLWFIRDLLILVLISPLTFWLTNKFNFTLVVLLLITWITGFDYIVLSNESIFFYTLGATLNIKNINIKIVKGQTFCAFLWFFLVLTQTILHYFDFEHVIFITVIHKISLIFGVLFIWQLYDSIFLKKDISKTKLYSLFSFSFFIFVSHEPLLSVFKKLFYYIFGKEEITSLIIYFLAPVVCIILCVIVAYILKNIFPRFYGIITGGR